MAEDSKPKRTTEPGVDAEAKVKTEVKTTAKKKSKKPKNRVVWLFACANRVARQAGQFIFNIRNPLFSSLREDLGVDLDTPILPVFPDNRNRLQLIEKLSGQDLKDDVIILVVGQVEDVENKKVQKLEGHEYVFFHPGERQYLLLSGETAGGAYKRANERKVKLESKLSKIFQPV